MSINDKQHFWYSATYKEIRNRQGHPLLFARLTDDRIVEFTHAGKEMSAAPLFNDTRYLGEGWYYRIGGYLWEGTEEAREAKQAPTADSVEAGK